MNWRRGLLLAGIHLLVAVPLSVWIEWPYWPWIRSNAAELTTAEKEQIKEYGELFNPCLPGGHLCYRQATPQELVVGSANLPASLFPGGHEPCTEPSGIGGLIEKRLGRTRKSETVIVAIFCFGAAIQWLLVGCFPLVRPKRWWVEPGAFITVCTVIGAILSPIPHVSPLSWTLAFLALLAWLWWFGLLVWKTARFGWQLVAHRRAAASN
jgi:hypothetical protein